MVEPSHGRISVKILLGVLGWLQWVLRVNVEPLFLSYSSRFGWDGWTMVILRLTRGWYQNNHWPPSNCPSTVLAKSCMTGTQRKLVIAQRSVQMQFSSCTSDSLHISYIQMLHHWIEIELPPSAVCYVVVHSVDGTLTWSSMHQPQTPEP